MKNLRHSFILLGLCALVGGLSYCQQKPRLAQNTPPRPGDTIQYLNWHDTVSYVGKAVCKSCHRDIYQHFIHTGMGQSLGPATPQKSIARLQKHPVLHDTAHQLRYHPFWDQQKLKLLEFRLSPRGDTLHRRIVTIDYVIGSGQHTNSHLVARNGYLTQAPFTWYAQKGLLDWPPGFEKGKNRRFGRPIGLECMSCHNAMPTQFVKGSLHKYRAIPQGIDCERCHGPGEAHVQKIQAGRITDTSRFIDPSIVNPAKLPRQLQFELCQRCHLQGNSVLKPGKTFFDFKPGMRLRQVMDTYLPRYSNSEDRFIMASHSDRLQQSACFQQSQMTCLTCHNPHKSVTITPQAQFNADCQSCHAPSEGPTAKCGIDAARMNAADSNCVGCHMPPSTTTDIPHVTVHDHYIRVPGQKPPKAARVARHVFLKMEAINNPHPSPRSKALAYLQHYERSASARSLDLDSARYFLARVSAQNPQYLFLWALYHHLARQPAALRRLVQQQGVATVLDRLHTKEYANRDAWTAYRIGEAFKTAGALPTAGLFFERAVQLAPYLMDFRVKMAAVLVAQQQYSEAQKSYRHILREKPWQREALSSLAYLYLREGRLPQADSLLQAALQRYPDYLQAWLNKAQLALLQNDLQAAQKALAQVLRIKPNHPKARALYQQLQRS